MFKQRYISLLEPFPPHKARQCMTGVEPDYGPVPTTTTTQPLNIMCSGLGHGLITHQGLQIFLETRNKHFDNPRTKNTIF